MMLHLSTTLVKGIDVFFIGAKHGAKIETFPAKGRNNSPKHPPREERAANFANLNYTAGLRLNTTADVGGIRGRVTLVEHTRIGDSVPTRMSDESDIREVESNVEGGGDVRRVFVREHG